MRPGIKLSDLLAAGGKVPPEIAALATKPAVRTKRTVRQAPPRDADRERHLETMRRTREAAAAIRLEALRLRTLRQAGTRNARAKRQAEQRRSYLADRIALFVIGTVVALLFLFGGR
jgi:hypothetical protein